MSIIKSEPAASLVSDSLMRLFDRFFRGNSVRARVARGTFWSLVATVSIQMASLASSILAARILGQTGFGELGMIRSTVLMFGVLAGSGLGLASTKYVAEFRDTYPARAGRLIGLLMNVAFVAGGGATLLCFVLAPSLAGWAMNAPHLMGPLQFGCVILLFNTLSGVQVGAVGGFEAFGVLARIAVMDSVLNGVSTHWGLGLWGEWCSGWVSAGVRPGVSHQATSAKTIMPENGHCHGASWCKYGTPDFMAVCSAIGFDGGQHPAF
jgi:O-antigen/teichoic acid export membrane protein